MRFYLIIYCACVCVCGIWISGWEQRWIFRGWIDRVSDKNHLWHMWILVHFWVSIVSHPEPKAKCSSAVHPSLAFSLLPISNAKHVWCVISPLRKAKPCAQISMPNGMAYAFLHVFRLSANLLALKRKKKSNGHFLVLLTYCAIFHHFAFATFLGFSLS